MSIGWCVKDMILDRQSCYLKIRGGKKKEHRYPELRKSILLYLRGLSVIEKMKVSPVISKPLNKAKFILEMLRCLGCHQPLRNGEGAVLETQLIPYLCQI